MFRIQRFVLHQSQRVYCFENGSVHQSFVPPLLRGSWLYLPAHGFYHGEFGHVHSSSWDRKGRRAATPTLYNALWSFLHRFEHLNLLDPWWRHTSVVQRDPRVFAAPPTLLPICSPKDEIGLRHFRRRIRLSNLRRSLLHLTIALWLVEYQSYFRSFDNNKHSKSNYQLIEPSDENQNETL